MTTPTHLSGVNDTSESDSAVLMKSLIFMLCSCEHIREIETISENASVSEYFRVSSSWFVFIITYFYKWCNCSFRKSPKSCQSIGQRRPPFPSIFSLTLKHPCLQQQRRHPTKPNPYLARPAFVRQPIRRENHHSVLSRPTDRNPRQPKEWPVPQPLSTPLLRRPNHPRVSVVSSRWPLRRFSKSQRVQ